MATTKSASVIKIVNDYNIWGGLLMMVCSLRSNFTTTTKNSIVSLAIVHRFLSHYNYRITKTKKLP